MACKPVCRLCDRLVLSQAVAFTGGNLEINLPAGAYKNGEKYCVVVAQAIPDTTTINAPVYFTIGTGTTLYPMTKRNCAQVTACGIRTRTKYSLCVVTTPTGGSRPYGVRRDQDETIHTDDAHVQWQQSPLQRRTEL